MTRPMAIGSNWMVFIRKHKTLPKVFKVRRDKMVHKLDTVKIAEISSIRRQWPKSLREPLDWPRRYGMMKPV